MREAGRVQAAIEVLAEVMERHRPASLALADWGRAHRFAGSGDRAAIGDLVYDALRKKTKLAVQMETDTPRAIVIAAASDVMGAQAVIAAADGSQHALAPLSQDEQTALQAVRCNPPAAQWAAIPEWLWDSFASTFGDTVRAEAAAFSQRAPLDMRANRLKADRNKVLKAFEKFGAVATPFSPVGVRIPPRNDGRRLPNVEAETAHGKGWFEIQDEGSQIAALLAGAGPRQQVLDLCAGSGGKTLAMGAEMGNTGQLYAYDRDRQQLRPIFERIKRAGLRNVQVMEAGDEAACDALGGRFDVVIIDAPCTGSGTWRRRPDPKWRLKPDMLDARIGEQRALLSRAAPLVKPGGRLVYVTCSVLPQENSHRIAEFRRTHTEFTIVPTDQAWSTTLGSAAPGSADGMTDTLLLSPARHGTDGFFVAVMARHSG